MRVGVIIWSLVPGRGVGECGARLVVVLRLYLFCFSFVEVRRPLIIFHSTGYPSGISVLFGGKRCGKFGGVLEGIFVRSSLSAVNLSPPPILDFIGTRITIAHLDELFNKIHEYFN